MSQPPAIYQPPCCSRILLRTAYIHDLSAGSHILSSPCSRSSHTPSHGTREVLIIYGSLVSSDPGDIYDTIRALVTDRIRVSIIGLSARSAVCDELSAKTNGLSSSSSSGSSGYDVATHEQHFHDLFLARTTPPVTRTKEQSIPSLLMMGFPSRTLAGGNSSNDDRRHRNSTDNDTDSESLDARDTLAYCACHSRPSREGYNCTRCGVRVCRLPAECPACGLTLILSTHLARSYHHLFPLRNWVEVSWSDARRSRACFACTTPFPVVPTSAAAATAVPRPSSSSAAAAAQAAQREQPPPPRVVRGLSESGRYACPECANHFCIDCDLFAHEVLHNCPGCCSDTRPPPPPAAKGGHGQAADATANGTMDGI